MSADQVGYEPQDVIVQIKADDQIEVPMSSKE